MKDNEIIKYIQSIEDRFPVNEWMIQGRHVWPLIKMIICSELSIENNKKIKKRAGKVSGFISRLKRHKSILSYDGISKKNADILIYHHNISRTLKLDNGTFFNVNLDPFALLLEKDFDILSLECMGDSHVSDKFRNTHVIDGYYQRSLLSSKLLYKFVTFNTCLKKYDAFLEECDETLKRALQERNICRLIYFMNDYSKLYGNIIKNNGVKLVITGCGYGIDTASIFMACKDHGIKCMEVQHGLAAGNGHRWYASWEKMPLDGTRYEMLPDIYWCWTERDKMVIDSWSGKMHMTHMGMRPIYSVMDIVEKMTSKMSLCINNGLPKILLSLQPEVEYPRWLSEVIQETFTTYNWIIRKHPRVDDYQRDFIARVYGMPNVYIDGVENIMLEKILMNTDLHITNHSAVTIDALAFGIKSIILSDEYECVFKQQIADGNVFVGSQKNILMKLIKDNITKRNVGIRIKEISERNEAFFKSII
ncbi:MAG: hypothetical protein J6H31_03850 [Butyrivibrio sp.]|nr:hypothetical protein [Butyrivibrio sp.]